MKRFILIASIFFCLVALGVLIAKVRHTATCKDNNNGKICVVASFYPMYYFASQVGGANAVVTNLTPAGSEPHDYEPSAQDIAAIEKSDLLVLNGGKLEAWGDKAQQIAKGTNTKAVVAGDQIANQQVEENGQTIQDPHVWLSPQLAKVEVDTIAQAFIKVDPAHQASYMTNAKQLAAKLDSLDASYKQGLGTCVEKNIVTSHAAFGYLAKAYGLTQVPIAGLSPDAEPSAQQLADIAKFAKQNNIHYIFFESLVSPKLSQTIASEIGAKTLVLDPIEGLSDDDIRQGKDYMTQMQMNLVNLKTALQCP